MKKWECSVCGYIHGGATPPEECPVCGAERTAFIDVTELAEGTESVSSSLDQTERLLDRKTQLSTRRNISEIILDFHLHPIAVHMPNGIIPMAFMFLLISVVFGVGNLEQAAFYSLFFTLLSMPAVLFTGYVTWKTKYRGALNSIFKIKITTSIVAIILLCLLVFRRMFNPRIFSSGGALMFVYIFFALCLVIAVGLAGHLGGGLVFKKKGG